MVTARKSRVPYLRRTGDVTQLIVDNKPFLMLGGELQNSSFSSSQHMDTVWSKLKAANLNTVLGSVSWEQIEPIEGQFDFTELDQNIFGARSHGLRLVILWFGSFKNGKSTYVPSWIKQNPQRFPRAETKTKEGSRKVGEVLSIFGTEAQKADAKAFAALMGHLGDIDQDHSTVIMVQVENEIGLLGDSRDRSGLAERRYAESVPGDLVKILSSDRSSFSQKFQDNFSCLLHNKLPKNATWYDIPCERRRIDELFMAYYYCSYVEQVALAGKSAYPLPLYTNVWQNYSDEDQDPNVPTVVGGGGNPGDYPSGGAVVEVLDIWQLLVPSLDFIAPDIYLNNYGSTCKKYCHRGQPLFIPEQRRDEYGARRIWHAFGSYNCLGTAPFGIDTLEPLANPVGRHYKLLADVSQHLIQAQSTPLSSTGFFFDELTPDGNDTTPPIEASFGDWDLIIERSFVFGTPSPGSGMVIHKGGNLFLLIGWGFQVTFKSKNPKAYFTGILRFQETQVIDRQSGEMKGLRILNGDETRSGQVAIMPDLNPDYGGFPICVTIPGVTGLATCEPYALVAS